MMTQPLWAEALSATFLLVLVFGTLAFANRKAMLDGWRNLTNVDDDRRGPDGRAQWGDALRRRPRS